MKHNIDDTIKCFKVRSVVKEYTQTYEIDYTKIFAPITKINTARVLLSLAKLRLAITTTWCEACFLHGELFEEIYIDLPPRCMIQKRYSQKVCRLKKLFV